MVRYGFTATRSLKPDHVPIIQQALAELEDGSVFVTGAARGGDTYIARALTTLFPRAEHRLVVSAQGWNEELVDGWLPNGTTRKIEWMREGTTHKDRNQRIVGSCDRLVGFALYDEHRQPRSGTWQTVRMGRRQGKLYRLIVLEPEEEGTHARRSGSGSMPAHGRSRRAPLSN